MISSAMKQVINKLMPTGLFLLFALFFLAYPQGGNALTFELPTNGDNIVGHPQWMQAQEGDDFCQIARHYDIGYFQLVEANPGVDPDKISAGTVIVIPSRFILPTVPRTGIIISLAELRLYYFPPGGKTVSIYPIGIGREDWITPLGTTKVVEKTINPIWNVPESIRKDRAKDGVYLPSCVQPGPDNPLGGYRMRLGIQKWTYLIHGTNDFRGVGRRSSSGCIRMLPEDVEILFPKVAVGTPVTIINTPYKVGWLSDKLFLEAHIPLQEQKPNGEPDFLAMKNIVLAAMKSHSGTINWKKAHKIAAQQNGTPQTIGKLNKLNPASSEES